MCAISFCCKPATRAFQVKTIKHCRRVEGTPQLTAHRTTIRDPYTGKTEVQVFVPHPGDANIWDQSWVTQARARKEQRQQTFTDTTILHSTQALKLCRTFPVPRRWGSPNAPGETPPKQSGDEASSGWQPYSESTTQVKQHMPERSVSVIDGKFTSTRQKKHPLRR